MPLLVLLVLAAFIVIFKLKGQLDAHDQRLIAAEDRANALKERVRALEGQLRGIKEAPGVAAALVVSAPPVVPASSVVSTSIVVPASLVVPTSIVVPTPIVVPASSVVPDVRVGPAIAVVPGVSAFALRASADKPGVPGVPGVPETASWEVVVGGNWLNKLGVLVFVVGVGLLVGYSMAHVGPAGRVAIGFALSLGMLATGVVLERRPEYANYAYGLIGGGWAGTYFTTYAMHGVDAAHVIDSDLLSAACLAIVAGGMIVHSIRYRSQTVTALAYVVAYVTLALTPLSGFSLVASVPLAVSLLVVAQRLGWSGISVLGLASTYGLFALRSQIFPGSAMDPGTLTPYLALAVYWATFEAADVIGLRSRAAGSPPAVPLFAINAVGYLGAAMLLLPKDEPAAMSVLLAATAAAYLASAVVRTRLLGRPPVAPDAGVTPRFGTAQGAVIIAAGLLAWAIDLRFTGTQETLALLLETELLLAAGFALGDPYLRRTGSAIAALVTIHALTISSTPILALVAVTWYANREWMRQRAIALDLPEHAYSWVALGLVAIILDHELAPAHGGLVGLACAGVLLEAGRWRAPEYRYQGYVAGVLSGWVIAVTFLLAPEAPSVRDAWLVLPVATLLAYAIAWRLVRAIDNDALDVELRAAAGIAASFGTIFLAVFEWRVSPPVALDPAWAATAAALIVIGAWRRLALPRWQGYALALAAAGDAARPLTSRAPETDWEIAGVGTVIVLLYLGGYLGRRAVPAPPANASELAKAERTVAGLLPLVATVSLALLQWRVLPPMSLAPAQAATAVVLIGFGVWRHRAGQRWQAYGLSLVAAFQTCGPLLRRVPEATSELWAAAIVAALLYLTAAVGRTGRRSETAAEGSLTEFEDGILVLLPVFGTFALGLAEWRWFDPPIAGAAWAITAAMLLAVGAWRRAVDLRRQAYAVFGLSAIHTLQLILAPEAPAPDAIMWIGVVIGVLYAASLTSRRAIGAASAPDTPAGRVEEICRVALSIAATLLLTLLIFNEARPTVVTVAWGLEGLTLLGVGFPARERALRLAGLAVLLLCIVKLFVFDLRELEALARIVSFVALGLVLLGVSWAYTRFRGQIKKFL